MVERNLAKVEVGSSRLLSRSSFPPGRALRSPFVFVPAVAVPVAWVRDHPAGWQSGHAAACKAVYAGSIPTPASRSPYESRLRRRLLSRFHSERPWVAVFACDPTGGVMSTEPEMKQSRLKLTGIALNPVARLFAKNWVVLVVRCGCNEPRRTSVIPNPRRCVRR